VSKEPLFTVVYSEQVNRTRSAWTGVTFFGVPILLALMGVSISGGLLLCKVSRQPFPLAFVAHRASALWQMCPHTLCRVVLDPLMQKDEELKYIFLVSVFLLLQS